MLTDSFPNILISKEVLGCLRNSRRAFLIIPLALMCSCGTTNEFYENRVADTEDVICPNGSSAYYLPGVVPRTPNHRRDMVCMPDEIMRQTGAAPKIVAQPAQKLQSALPAKDPPAGAMKVDMGFPAPGTKWVSRLLLPTDQTTTYFHTVLEDGTHEGTAVYRVSAGPYIQLFDKATGSLIANLLHGKETVSYSPHLGSLSWPLYVGKTWTSRYAYHDRVRGMSIDPVIDAYQVQAWETVVTPAGKWNAFRIQSKSADGTSVTTYWYAPDTKLIVKWTNETTAWHRSGATKSSWEITEYPAGYFPP